MNKKNVKKFFNFIFYSMMLIILLNSIYNIFEPFFVNLIYGDNNLVIEEDVVYELSDSIYKYTNKIIYKNNVSANMDCSLLNQKNDKIYEDIYNSINIESEYEIVVKYAYKLYDETYRCYFLIKDENYSTIEINNIIDKTIMHEFVIKLNREASSYKIVYDNFI